MKDSVHHTISYIGLAGLYFKHYIWPLIEKLFLKKAEQVGATEEDRIVAAIEKWHEEKDKKRHRRHRAGKN